MVRLNIWPLTGGSVVINNNVQQPYNVGWGQGCCGGFFSPIMEKMMTWGMANSMINNLFSGLRSVIHPQQTVAPQQTYLPASTVPMVGYRPQQMGFYPYVNFGAASGGMYGFGSRDGLGANPQQAAANDAQNLRKLVNMMPKGYKAEVLTNENGSFRKLVVQNSDGKTIDTYDSIADFEEAVLANKYYKPEGQSTEQRTSSSESSGGTSQNGSSSTQAAESSSGNSGTESGSGAAETSSSASSSSSATGGKKSESSGTQTEPKKKTSSSNASSSARRYSRGTAPAGYKWIKYSGLNQASKKRLTGQNANIKTVDQLVNWLFELGGNREKIAEYKQLLMNANPTAIDDNGNIVKPEKLDLVIKARSNASANNTGGSSTVTNDGITVTRNSNGTYTATKGNKSNTGRTQDAAIRNLKANL